MDVDVELCTTTLGAAVPLWLKFEFRRERTAVGGGERRRGDCGHVGVVSPEPMAVRCCILGSFETASVTGPPWSWGTLVADKARCMAAAEGTVPAVADKAGGRCGLLS